MEIRYKLEHFEGPLDLLLHLIDKNKVDIYDIPIVEITRQYLEYVRNMEREDLNIVSDFLVMAATLLDIKARMLLPREINEEGEEEEQERLRRMAAARAAAAVLPRQQRPKRYGPLVLLIVLTVLLLAAVVVIPPLVGGWFERQAIARGRVEDPTVTPAQGEAAVAAPFTYRLTGADWVDYDGPWQMPEGGRLLRVELAVSMAGGEPDWDPEDPYLALDDGSYRMALPYYQLEEILDEEDPALGAFPYEVYWLETPGEAAACSFYYLVPAQTGKATICFERYSADRYGVRLEEIAELTFTIAGEGAQG